ncbi:DUF7344 domain-containing protein [Natronorarus salvus]|uniref:DUF7344 domain-containing protein n=1 Tax=Natronorarus salvus TaxID=3117733 RepID=UPI002F262DE8
MATENTVRLTEQGGTDRPADRPVTEQNGVRGDGSRTTDHRALLGLDTTDQLDRNKIFDVLKNQRRRYVIRYLSEREGPVELRDMAVAMAEWENGNDYISHKDRKRAYVSLYQTHLPKMSEYGVIEYDQPRGTIEPTPRLEQIETYLDISPGNTFLWHRLYLMGGLTGVALLALNRLWIVPVANLPDRVVFLVVLGILSSVILLHTAVSYSRTRRPAGSR